MMGDSNVVVRKQQHMSEDKLGKFSYSAGMKEETDSWDSANKTVST